ncbi:hypothetical protein GGF37_002307 [Kickxella alabastrina]|nr:hypothetical protein GGF37_002307 [Kickxella alabastrina]
MEKTGAVNTIETPTTAVAADTDSTDMDGDKLVSIPAQNIRHFKEAVVNTSRLLKVFGEQEKELTKAKAEVAKAQDDARRVAAAAATVQREADNRARLLAKANAETATARALVEQREAELSRVRGQKEDLEAQVGELRQASPAVEQVAPVPAPDAALGEEIERLRREVEAKEGSLKSLRISRDAIRSSTKAEIMSIQARYAREQAELINRQEKEMAQHRGSLASREADLEQEQERLMQMEMDLGMRTTQLEDQVADLTAALAEMTAKHDAAQGRVRSLEDAAKVSAAEHRAEAGRLARAAKKDEKRVADLETQLERLKAQAREAARARPKPRPKSTATAAEAVLAATEDVAAMDLAELRAEVASLRADAVHKNETIRRQEVLVMELERKQNPEGRRPRGRVAELQAELDKMQAALDERTQAVATLEAALRSSASPDNASVTTAVAQLNLRVISLEAALSTRDQRVGALERELAAAREAASERPMRLRHAQTAHSSAAAAALSLRSPDLTALRARTTKLQQERAALLELVTEQQVTIRQLRGTGQVSQPAPLTLTLTSQPLPSTSTSIATSQPVPQPSHPLQPLPQPVPAPKRRMQPASAALADEIELAGVVAAKRHKNGVADTASTATAASTPSEKGAKPVAEANDAEAMERVLRDKRINGANRAKRFFSLLQKSPQELEAALLGMTDDMPVLDVAEFHRQLLAYASATPLARRLLPPSEPSVLHAIEASAVTCIWTLCFKNAQGSFFASLMRHMAQSIVSPVSSPAATCSLARIFAALSLVAGDIQRVRIMLCDLLMDAVDSPHTLPVLANTLAVYPAALTMPLETERAAWLVVRVVQAIAAGIHDLYAEEHSREEADALYTVMVNKCAWHLPAEAEFADRVLVEVSNELRSLHPEDSAYAVVMCAHNLLAPYMVAETEAAL